MKIPGSRNSLNIGIFAKFPGFGIFSGFLPSGIFTSRSGFWWYFIALNYRITKEKLPYIWPQKTAKRTAWPLSLNGEPMLIRSDKFENKIRFHEISSISRTHIFQPLKGAFWVEFATFCSYQQSTSSDKALNSVSCFYKSNGLHNKSRNPFRLCVE